MPKIDGARMVSRRVFLRLVFTLGGGLMTGFPEEFDSIDAEVVDLLRDRTQRLRLSATEIVHPLIPSLESHGELLARVFATAPAAYRHEVGRMASEVAWLAANAHSDNGDDRQSLDWGKRAARLARDVRDHDLRAHALTRVSRTFLSLKEPTRAVITLRKVDAAKLSHYGRARLEVHRALALARDGGECDRKHAALALKSLDVAREALMLGRTTNARPDWVWWQHDEGFVKTWESEVLRSLVMPHLAVPAFHAAVVTAAHEDVRELPFLRAGLAEVLGQGGHVDAAADEAVRAVLLVRAVDAEAALGRIRGLYRLLATRAPNNRHVRSLREALRS
ncbi:hypothetical protein [Micromonospora sp. WMMC415]|uniref:hypothetical protein n=1 Tax=Micromonospora sp. WMMC415 TaxID=2675222 RepID=UPI001E48C748|nr:hypothetical protein [Micromonospora sp. WMMC415]